jgi:hypothetical protein
MVLQGQTDQGTRQDCSDHALHRYPEWLDAGGGMQTEKRLFDDRAKYCFRDGALHVNPFPLIYDRNSILVQTLAKARVVISAKGAVSSPAWGSAPGLFATQNPALKARFNLLYFQAIIRHATIAQ